MSLRSHFLLCSTFLIGSAFAVEFHVSPDAAAGGDGSSKSPFGNVIQARDALRELRKKGPLTEAATVWIHDGTFETSAPLVLEAQDAGSEKFPVMFRAAKGAKPLFIGGPKVANFIPHHGEILKADISGLNLSKSTIRQLLFAGQRQPLARYPNANPADPLYSGWAFIDDIPEGKSDGHLWKREAYLKATDLRHYDKPEELELNIFAGHGWWNFIQPVASIDTATSKLTLAKDCGYELYPGNRYFIQNALQELDAPGEWYIDRESQTLYFWPPAPIASSEVRIPTIDSFVKILAGAKYVTIRGLSFTACVNDAITLQNSENCTIAGCTLSNVGGWSGTGISINGKNNLAVGNDISYTGNGGISLYGGDRDTLTSANNIADNNHIHHVGVLQKNGPGVSLGGVGNQVTHNHIHHTPRMAVQFGGNNFVIDYNHMHHTVLETQDGGAVYTGGRDWISSRGTSLKYNFIHDTIGLGQDKGVLDHPHFTWGIYMDDNAAGLDIVGNIVARSARGGLHLHNGRDHLIENNVFVDGGERQIEYGGWTDKHPFFKSHLPTMIAGWDKIKDQPAWKSMRNIELDPRNAVRPDGTIMSGNLAQRNIIAWSDASLRYADFRNCSPAYNTLDYNLVWNGGKPINTAVTKTGKDVGPELLEAKFGVGKTLSGWGWNHRPRPEMQIEVKDGVLSVEAATSPDPKNNHTVIHGPDIAVKAGAAYRTRLKIKGSEPAMTASFAYGIYAAGAGYWQTTSKTVQVTNEWQEVEVAGAMLPTTDPKWAEWMKNFWLRMDVADDKGTIQIKDVTLHEADPLNSWDSWQTEGWDQHSVVADPLFVNAAKDDYRLQKNSPAFKLGFKQIPVEKIGQYPSELRAE